MTLEEIRRARLLDEIRQARAADTAQPQSMAQTANVDLRPQPGEAREAYQARIMAARAQGVPVPAGSQEMTGDALSSIQQSAPPPRQIGMAEDIVRSGVSGIGRGVTGLLDTAAGALPINAARNLYNAVQTARNGGGITDTLSAAMPQPMLAQLADQYTGGGLSYAPRTTAGEYAGTVGEFLPGGAAARSPFLLGAVPGMASEFAGQMTEGMVIEGFPVEPVARFGAALAAPTVAQAMSHPGSVARAIYGRGTVEPSTERLAAGTLLDDVGVPMTAGQRIGNESMLRREMLTGPGQEIARTQNEAFTRAILGTIGEDAIAATPTVLNRADLRIGKAFDDVATGIDVVPNMGMATTADDIARVYNSTVEVGSKVGGIGEITNEIIDAVTSPTSGVLPSRLVMNWRSQLGPLVRSNSDATRTAARQLREMLEDAIEARLIATGRPEDIAKWTAARSQYRNFLIVETAATRAGQASTEGILSPSALRSALVTQDRRAYATGRRGDIADIARAGETIIRKPATSGTSENDAARGLSAVAAGTFGAGLGATVGTALGYPALGSMAGTVGMLLAPAGYRRLGMTGPVQNALVRPGPPLVTAGQFNALSGLLAQ